MDSHHQHLARGFNWLGGATILAKIIDFSTILAVLVFLTKEQVGLASIVVSIAMVVEAFDGLGTSEALVQASSVSRLQLDTLFWFIIGAALLVGGATLLAAPWIAAAYSVAGMQAYFVAAAIKQPLVGAALIPLAMMNRDLQYERIAVVSVCATLAAALTRLGLAVAGAGAWAVVGAYTASGLYMLIGASLARPFRPRLQFQLAAIRPLLNFGTRAAAANIFEQIFKNIDFLLVGWFYGTSQLAVYRVAFDVAMEPAMAVGTVVNRTALPVFARVKSVRLHLAQSLVWALRRLVTLVAPLMVGLILVADPLMTMLHDDQGNSYGAAALPLKILAGAALLRVTAQLLTPLLMASGGPGIAARLSAAILLLLSLGIVIAGIIFDARTGIIAVSAVWLGVYPLLLGWGAIYLRRHWDMRLAELVPALAPPVIGIAGMVAIVEALQPFAGANPAIRIGLVLVAMAATYAGLFVHGRRHAAID